MEPTRSQLHPLMATPYSLHTSCFGKVSKYMYRIRPNSRGAQFSWIAISKHYVETIFTDQEFQEFRVYGILKFCELNFCGLLGICETAKIMRLEDLGVYGKCSCSINLASKRSIGLAYVKANTVICEIFIVKNFL